MSIETNNEKPEINTNPDPFLKINTFYLGGYKAFKDVQEIPVRSITLVFGPNSSGKSSVLWGLEAAITGGTGINAEFVSHETKNVRSKHKTMGFKFADGRGNEVFVKNETMNTFQLKSNGIEFYISNKKIVKLESDFSNNIILNLHNHLTQKENNTTSINNLKNSFINYLKSNYEFDISSTIFIKKTETNINEESYYSYDYEHSDASELRKINQQDDEFESPYSPGSLYSRVYDKIVHSINENYFNVMRYLHLANKIDVLHISAARNYKSDKEYFQKYLQADKSIFFEKVNKIIVNDLHLQFEYDVLDKKVIDKRVGKKFKYENVGSGIKKLLPVIASTIESNSGKFEIVLIEEPEIHLHPNLQSDVADLFVNSVINNSEKTFILETHSENLLQRILRRVREGKISHEAVCVLYVHPGVDEEGARVECLEIDEDGEFKTSWPKGFFDSRIDDIVAGYED